MKKAKQFLILLLSGSIFLAGCGRRNIPDSGSALPSSDTAENSKGNPGSGPGSSEEVSSGGEGTPSSAATQESEPPSPTAGVLTLKQGYSDLEREVSVIGLKEYKSLTSDRYTDKAKKGRKFLVLFLKVHNKTNEKVYFNVNYLSAKADGKKIENTVLFNDPEGYPTIFSNIVPDSYYGGFIVWEVPENWNKMEVAYEGWRDSNGLTLKGKFTKKDLSEPEKYSESTYGQGNAR